MKKIEPTDADNAGLTIGRLAKAAKVGVETIRYYQRRGLLPVPKPVGAVQYYPSKLIDRIGFTKRAQSLGLSLKDISTLLDLEHGGNRRAVEAAAQAQLGQIRSKLSNLQRTQATLQELVERCPATGQAHLWGYNGQSPGPTIEVVEGDRVRIFVTNKLPEHTSVHWHGQRLPNGMDGVGGSLRTPFNRARLSSTNLSRADPVPSCTTRMRMK